MVVLSQFTYLAFGSAGEGKGTVQIAYAETGTSKRWIFLTLQFSWDLIGQLFDNQEGTCQTPSCNVW